MNDETPPESGDLALDQLAAGIVRTVREPLLVLDARLVVRTANPSFYRTFHLSREATGGRPLYALGSGAWDIPVLRERLTELLEEGGAGGAVVEGFEVEHSFEGLGDRVMILNARRIDREQAGEPLILVAIEDVTERTRARRALEDLTHQLSESNQELERFAYVASHDLQEPLRMISSYTTLLSRRYGDQLDEKAQKYIAYAVDGAERMQALIGGLLAYSRASRMDGEFEPVELDRIVATAVSDLAVLIREVDAEIDVDSLPRVVGDEDRLTQVFRNLLGNALKFRGEAVPRIRITCDRLENEWRIGVHDNGIGISEDYFDQIFLIFKRLNPRREYEGAGLGLALCRKIIEQHGGRMYIESELGQGSSFFMILPTLDGEP